MKKHFLKQINFTCLFCSQCHPAPMMHCSVAVQVQIPGQLVLIALLCHGTHRQSMIQLLLQHQPQTPDKKPLITQRTVLRGINDAEYDIKKLCVRRGKGCYPERLKAEVVNSLWDLQNSSYHWKAICNILLINSYNNLYFIVLSNLTSL